MYHVDDLPYRDVRKELPMVFAPFGRAVRGNFKAADAAAVARARSGQAGVRIREELGTPREFYVPGADMGEHSLENLEDAWPTTAELPNALPIGPATKGADQWWIDVFIGGETAGLRRLEAFLANDVRKYKETRNGLIG